MLKTKSLTTEKAFDFSDLSVIIVKMPNHNQILLDLTMLDWVRFQVQDLKLTMVDFDKDKSIHNLIKPTLQKTKYTLVLFSNTPLITRGNLNFILDYLMFKQVGFLKLPHGYAFETKQFETINKLNEFNEFAGDASEFFVCNSNEEVAFAADALQIKIIKNLSLNGVNIPNPKNVVIGATCKIEPGVTIEPFNTILNDTTILSGCVLGQGNKIINSFVGKNAAIANSEINQSTICENTIVFPFNIITNSYIDKNCTIKSHNKITDAKILEGTTIQSFNEIG